MNDRDHLVSRQRISELHIRVIREKKYQSDGRVVGQGRAMGGSSAQGGRGHSQGGQRETQVRDALLSKKCSFFEHCSKGL